MEVVKGSRHLTPHFSNQPTGIANHRKLLRSEIAHKERLFAGASRSLAETGSKKP